MSYTVEILGGAVRATVKDRRWSSDDRLAEQLLNAHVDPTGPSGSDPDPDYTLALEAARRWKGRIIDDPTSHD